MHSSHMNWPMNTSLIRCSLTNCYNQNQLCPMFCQKFLGFRIQGHSVDEQLRWSSQLIGCCLLDRFKTFSRALSFKCGHLPSFRKSILGYLILWLLSAYFLLTSAHTWSAAEMAIGEAMATGGDTTYAYIGARLRRDDTTYSCIGHLFVKRLVRCDLAL